MPTTANTRGPRDEQLAHVVPERPVDVGREGPTGIGGGHGLDEKAGDGPDHGEGHQDEADHEFLPAVDGGQHAAEDGAGDDGEEGERFQDAVAAREHAGSEDLGHDAVLGGDEEGGMGAHAEDAGQHDPRSGLRMAVPPQPEAGQGHEADEDLDDLPDDQGVALAVAVGEPAGHGGEDGPGQIEEQGHEGDRPRLAQHAQVDGVEHGGGVDGLVVEGGEELGDEHSQEGPRMQVVGRLEGLHGMSLARRAGRREDVVGTS